MVVHSSLSLLSSALPSNCSTTSSTRRFLPIFDRDLGYPKWKLQVLPKQQGGLIEDNGSAKQFLQNNSVADFMRFIKRDSDLKSVEGDGCASTELQTAVVSYRKMFPMFLLQPSLQVDLVSTIHIADKEYFATLQKELKSYDCVLYEMVATRATLKGRISTAKKKLKGSNSRKFNLIGFLQRQMARLLVLDFQLDCINYEADNWYHADLDLETFQLLQHEKGESFFTFARDTTLKAMMESPSIPEDHGSWRSKLLQLSRVLPMPLLVFIIIEKVRADAGSETLEYSELEALSKLDFGAALKVFLAKRITSEEFSPAIADVEEESVIIGERNKAAIEALRKAITEGHKKIAILYGCGHMPDLGRRLREEFQLVPSKVQWVTAWSIRNQNLTSDSPPILKELAKFLRWPLDRNQTLALLVFSYVMAVDIWLWELLFGTTVDWISHIASHIFHYIQSVKII